MRLLEPSGIRADLGSFWYENVSKDSQQKLRMLLDAVTGSTAYTEIYHALHRLVDKDVPVEYENVTVVARWAETLHEGETWYRAGINTTSQPLLLLEGGNQYVAGLDFVYDPATQDILFPTKPSFDSFVIRLGLAENAGPMFHSVLYGLFAQTRMGHTELISKYLRGDHHPESLEHAIRAVLGMKRVEKGGKVLDRQDLATETVYVLENEVIRVPYSHKKHVVGSILTPDLWFGAEIASLSIYDGSSDWYRERNYWGDNGLDLFPAIGLNLTATDTQETVVTTHGATGFSLQEDVAGDAEKFWTRVAANESVYNNLGNKYPLASTVNPVDVFFQDFMDHAIILTLNAKVLTPHAIIGIRNWFVRHCPFGYLPLVRVKTNTVEQNYSQWDPDITGVPSVGGMYENFGFVIYNEGFLAYNGYPLTLSADLGEYPSSAYANHVLGYDIGDFLLGDEYLIFI